ncbi:hypothetical protein [Oceanibium sediminis]|uniref:hypothetical protein n=1 Tax=Oceanibium sediminis TaxID=2026339 RepID=UPI000DD32239|nr:hypothetical protein [Oceanibium sediminis]
MSMNDDQYRPGAEPDEGDDELLNTIRQMVSEEAARGTVDHPGHLPPTAEAVPPPSPQPAKPAPLVLGALTRVSEGVRPSNVTRLSTAQNTADPALRGLVSDLVREELEHAIDGVLEARLRKMIRSELTDLLARARNAD